MTIWLLIRVTGFLAYFYFTWAVVAGLLRKSKVPQKCKNLLFHMHTNVGWYGLFTLIAHFLFVVADTYIDYSLLALLIPFTGDAMNVYLGLGIIASYLFVAVLCTSDVWLTKMNRTVWKWVHFMSLPAWLLALLHGLGIGTDTSRPLISLFYASSALLVIATLSYRMKKHATVVKVN